MKAIALLAALLAASSTIASAADTPNAGARQAFQDHIAYVATFSVPVLIEKCTALDPAYMQKAAPLYFRYVNQRQAQIERGRLLTLAELAPDQTLQSYREKVLTTRLGKLDTGTREEKLAMCERALDVLSGEEIPGEWPARK